MLKGWDVRQLHKTPSWLWRSQTDHSRALTGTQKGYTVSVGRIREDESGIFDIKFVALSHNSKAVWASQFCVIATDDV
jgi:aspartate-semialdehyde dehydrogenase